MTINRRRARLLLWFVVITVSVTIPLMIMKSNIATEDGQALYGNVGSNEANEEMEEMRIIFNETLAESIKLDPVPFRWCPWTDHGNDSSRNDNEKSFIDCNGLISGDKAEQEYAKSWTPPCSYSDPEMEKIACNCDQLKRHFFFEEHPLSREEMQYPLAFVLVVEKNAEQVIRLLASIYQPQNIYCLSYDEHSSDEFKSTIRCLKNCFNNVVMPEKHVEVYWADISIMDATMNCIKTLASQKRNRWKYLQILSWNDIPLRTNAEMVKIFQILNGSCDSELTFGQVHRFRKYHFRGGVDMSKVGVLRPVPPDGLTMYKGSFAVSLSREFCQFVIDDPIAQRLYNYSRPVWAPEEQFWSTLIHNPNLNSSCYFPGTCLHYYDDERKNKEWISRFQVWDSDKCAGHLTSGSCCFGVGDLPMLTAKPHLVAHKFYADFQPATLYCVLKWKHQRTYSASVAGKFPLNMKFYENLAAVRYQRIQDKSEFTC